MKLLYFVLAKSRYAKLSGLMSAILPYLCFIDSTKAYKGVEQRLLKVVECQGKATKMANFMEEFNTRHPTQMEIDAGIMVARKLRARAMRNGASSLWAMLRRVTALKPVHAKTSEV